MRKTSSSVTDYIPRFRMVHCIELINGILVCSCGLPHRYGCPCRHLFSLEPSYDLSDVSVRWHTGFSYYGYQPGYERLTSLYESKRSVYSPGIRPKTLDTSESSASLPYLLHGASLEAVM